MYSRSRKGSLATLDQAADFAATFFETQSSDLPHHQIAISDFVLR
jgi:hypothetical protein